MTGLPPFVKIRPFSGCLGQAQGCFQGVFNVVLASFWREVDMRLRMFFALEAAILLVLLPSFALGQAVYGSI
ncbi:MAG TPA: hypothetical protein VET69_09420, partial [Terriglobales bacterium]|nr:hypothetical protein [Terriglobales bacterium]